jgi:hypothetical protein
MILQPDNYIVRHFPLPIKVKGYLSTTVDFPTHDFHNLGKIRFRAAASQSCERITRPRCASALRVPLTFSVSLRAGVRSCVLHRQFLNLEPRKSTERAFGSTNKCSVLRSQGLRGCSGRQRQRRTSPRPLDVVKERLNSILQASVIGLEMRSQPSFLKFLNVTACAT